MQNYWHQPNIDPVLIHLWGPFQIRWYSLLYVGGFLVGRYILKRLAREKRFHFTENDVEEMIVWLLVGTVIGARLIYCLVYDPDTFWANPLTFFEVYKGGLSFHGGFIGIVLTAWIFAKKKGIPFFNLTDAMALATPIGLFMGRMGNFINGELFGRISYVPWAIVFKHGGPEPRHPSQLYEGILEGVLLFAAILWVKKKSTRDGLMSYTFGFGYAAIRFFVEFFREPDAQVGYLPLGLTMGQYLCIAMMVGVGIIYWQTSKHQPKPGK